jgi:hypothetical protein
MTFEECELAILRHAVDETDEIQKRKAANSDEVKHMIEIVETFLIRKKLICYGGTAINNILPKTAQFYDPSVDIADYDFFSQNPLDDAKELADLYYKSGYANVEARSGVHYGTFKVFVNYIPMADITYIPETIFKKLLKDAISIAGIKYCPADYLRMAMYLELSRPAGDVTRWEKVLKRLTLLNRHYPLKPPYNCGTVDFQRSVSKGFKHDIERVYYIVRDALIEQGVVFFGGYAASLYSKYMPERERRLVEKIPDFDVISEDIERTAVILLERLKDAGFKNAVSILHDEIGEIVPKHVEIRVNRDTVAFLYEPIACHNYNKIIIDGKEIFVATIDTMLSFYLAFLYVDKPYFVFDKNRILCMAKFMFEVQQKNRLAQRGLLKRFSVECYGKQKRLEDIREEKTDMFKKLKKGTREYEMWFLKYSPGEKGGPILKHDVKLVDDLGADVKMIRTRGYKRAQKQKTEKKREAEVDAESKVDVAEVTPDKEPKKKTRKNLLKSIFPILKDFA